MRIQTSFRYFNILEQVNTISLYDASPHKCVQPIFNHRKKGFNKPGNFGMSSKNHSIPETYNIFDEEANFTSTKLILN
jgi:hypothetical protein